MRTTIVNVYTAVVPHNDSASKWCTPAVYTFTIVVLHVYGRGDVVRGNEEPPLLQVVLTPS